MSARPNAAETAADAIGLVTASAAAWAEAAVREAELEDQRPLVKHAAILRLMQVENPITEKPYTATAAEKDVERDPRFMEHRKLQHEATRVTIRHRAAYESARLTAELAVGVAVATAQQLARAAGR